LPLPGQRYGQNGPLTSGQSVAAQPGRILRHQSQKKREIHTGTVGTGLFQI
jgi:hypothetical protein